MPPFRNYHIRGDLVGSTLSGALKKLLAGETWGKVKSLISGRHVQVNGNLCLDEGRRLSEKDVVKVWEQPLAKPVTASDVRLLYVDDHLVVVEKPAGMTTLRHPEERHWPARRKQLQPTLDEALPRVLAKKLGIPVADEERTSLRRGRTNRRPETRRTPPKPKLPRVRAVHRLDRDTSGLMVFARTPQAEQTLVRLFSKHKIERAYVAVVHGAVEEQTIRTWLVRDRGDGLRGSSPLGKDAPESQEAITHVKPLETFEAGGETYSLIECRLETGRTHQIRIHLSERGHMLSGEKTYTHAPGEKPRRDVSAAPRQALHAAVLGLVHPLTQQTLAFRTKLPRDLEEWLARLKNVTK
ncbi:MAG: RluA family pseudouridine synthase [Pirellulaceae bacterium]